MINKNLIKLRANVTDRATGMTGSITHWTMNMSQQVKYLFQPNGLDPETGQPLKKIYLEDARLEVRPEDYAFVEIPFEILGSKVKDTASGFKGMAIEFMMHTNGCFHVVIQPKGLIKKTNLPAQPHDFDLRSCTGKKIQTLTEEERAEDVRQRPSPVGDAMDAVRSSAPNL